MQISDIKLRQYLQKTLIPLRLTRLSRIDVYEHLVLIQQDNTNLMAGQIENYRKRFMDFAQTMFKNRN